MENERLTRAAAAQGAENLAKLKDLNVLIIGCTGIAQSLPSIPTSACARPFPPCASSIPLGLVTCVGQGCVTAAAQ